MNSIKKNFVYNSIYQILSICIPLVTTPYLSRTLGPDGIGIYSYTYSISYFFMIFVLLGVNNYGNRTIAQSRATKIELSKTFFSIYTLQLTLGVILLFLYSLYNIFISANKTITLIMGMYVLSSVLDINWFFFGIEKFKVTVFRNSAFKILTTIAVFIFVKDSGDVSIYCGIMSFGTLISQMALWSYLRKEVCFYRPSFSEVIVHLKPNLFLFITVIAVSLYKYMDKIMLGLISNTEQVGYYEASEKIVAVPVAFITALGTVMLPRVSNMISEGKDYDQKLLNNCILLAMFFSTAMCFGIMGVSKEFIPLFYGDGYDACINLYLILLPSCIFLAFANVVRTQYLLPLSKDKIYVISACVGAVINLVINAILIPSLGSAGAAIGTLLAEAGVCVFQVGSVSKEIPILKYAVHSLPFIFAGVFMFILIFMLNIVDSVILNLVLKIIIGSIIYFILLFIMLKIFKVKIRT